MNNLTVDQMIQMERALHFTRSKILEELEPAKELERAKDELMSEISNISMSSLQEFLETYNFSESDILELKIEAVSVGRDEIYAQLKAYEDGDLFCESEFKEEGTAEG